MPSRCSDSTYITKRGTGNVMVSHCANPDCRRELHYLRDGKIYQFVLSPKTGSKRLEHFWLCGECFKNMTLICVNQSEDRDEEHTPVCPRMSSWKTGGHTRRSTYTRWNWALTVGAKHLVLSPARRRPRGH